MAYETLVAVFETPTHAAAAANALKAGGFHEDDMSVFDNDRLSAGTSALAQSVKEAGLWHRLFGGKVLEHEAAVYGQTVARGGTVISLRMLDSEVADVTLHEEHAEVLRRAVTDPAYVGDVDWEDRTIEVVETAEQALVSKTARIVEEISLKKVGSEHVETVHEKLRRQQAEIEQVEASGSA